MRFTSILAALVAVPLAARAFITDVQSAVPNNTYTADETISMFPVKFVTGSTKVPSCVILLLPLRNFLLMRMRAALTYS